MAGRLADRIFDLHYGLETSHRHSLAEVADSPNVRHGTRYQPTGVLTFRAMLRTLDLPHSAVFLDIGAGKGRVLLLAAHLGFTTVRGIEFSPALCAQARANIRSFQAKHKAVANPEVIEGDVMDYRFTDTEQIFYFFDVFHEALFKPTLDRILESLRRRPRPAWILYLHPRLARLVDALPGLACIFDGVVWGYAWKVYHWRPGTAPDTLVDIKAAGRPEHEPGMSPAREGRAAV